MDGYLVFFLDKLAVAGFLGTRASLLLDIIVTFLALLPLFTGISIMFATRRELRLHQVTQFLLFFLMLIILLLFAYVVHYKTGFEALLQESTINPTIAFIGLIIHIVISLVTFTLWMFALLYALSDKKRRGLPGVYSMSHANAGKRVFKFILLTALSSVSIYWMLFMA